MAGFFFRWGSAYTPDCTAKPLQRRVVPVEINSTAVTRIITQQIEINLPGIDPADLSVKMLEIEAVIAANPYPSGAGIVWRKPDTTEYLTGHYLEDNVTTPSFGGIRCTDLAWNPSDLTLATEVKGTITLQAEYAVVSNEVYAVDETITIIGNGGPVHTLAPQVAAMAVYQTLSDYSPVQVVQSGTVYGKNYMPALPDDIIPELALPFARQNTSVREVRKTPSKIRAIWQYQSQYSITFLLPKHPDLYLISPNVTLPNLTPVPVP